MYTDGRDPPLHNVSFKNILVETLNNVGHPTRCPQSLNSVRLMVHCSMSPQLFFEAHIWQRGGPGRLRTIHNAVQNTFRNAEQRQYVYCKALPQCRVAVP